MKIITLFHLLLFVLLLNCKAQTPKRYYYNYAEKTVYKKTDTGLTEIETPLAFRAGKDIRIIIQNYNPLRTDIIINDTSYNMFLQDGEKVSSLFIVPSVKGVPVNQSSTTAKAAVTEENFFSYPLTDKKSNIYSITKLTSCNILDRQSSRLNELNRDITKRIMDYKSFVIKVEFINKKLTNLKLLKELSTTAVKRQLIFYITELNSSLYDTLNVDPAKTSGQDILAYEERFFRQISNDYDSLELLKQAVDKLDGKDCPVEYINKIKNFTESYSVLEKQTGAFITTRNEKGLTALMTNTALYDELIQYTVNEPEEITYARTIENDKHSIYLYEKEPGKDKKIYDIINIEPMHGWKVDFAGGIFFSGLSDRSYTKITADSFILKKYTVGGIPGGQVRDTLMSQTYTHLYEKDQIKLGFGAMVYMHYHTRNPSGYNFGLYVGFGALFNDQTRFCMGTGASFIIGKTQRFSISLGGVIAQVDRLDPPYNTDTWYTTRLDNIPTSRVWKLQPSLGISWNFK